MMKIDASQPPSTMADGNSAFAIEQRPTKSRGYFQDLWQSFDFIYLKYKWFDDKDWKLAFCSSPFETINQYPNIFLVYRTVILVLAIVDLAYDIVHARSLYECSVYYTHLAVVVTFLAIIFQFLITSRVRFYRGDNIVPRQSLQCIHVILIFVSLGSGLAVCLVYWTMFYEPASELYFPKLIFEHGVLWLLFLIDIFCLTRLPLHMIDCIPLMTFASLYALITGVVCLVELNSDDEQQQQLGYMYQALNANYSPARVSLHLFVFIFVLPVAIVFVLWNLFRLRRSIHSQTTSQRQASHSHPVVE